MNTIPFPGASFALGLSLAAATALFSLPAANAAAVNTWKVTTGGAATVTGTDTNNLVATGTGSVGLFAVLPDEQALTLDRVGDILTFSGQLAFTATINLTSGGFRWGLYNGGTSTNPTNINGWYGYHTSAIVGTSKWLYERSGTGGWNSTTNATAVPVAEIIGGTGSGKLSQSATSGGSFDVLFRLEKTGSGLAVSWGMEGTGDTTYAISGTWHDSTPVTGTINRIAMQLMSTMGQTSGTFSNLDFSKTSLAPTIVYSPGDQTVDEGAPVTLSTTVTGRDPLVYQWKRNGAALADDERLTGATSGTLRITHTPFAGYSGTYTLTVGNDIPLPDGEVTSDPAVLTVTQAASTPAVPANLAASGITTSSFVATWDAVQGATGYKLDVATGPGFSEFVDVYNGLDLGPALSCTVQNLAAGTLYYYRVLACNSRGDGTPAVSSATTVAPPSAPPVFTSGSTAIFAAGVECRFILTASGTPAPQFIITGQPDWLSLDGASGVLHGIPPDEAIGAPASFVVTASNGAIVGGSIVNTGQTFTVNIESAPTITLPWTVSTLAGQAGVGGTADGAGAAARFTAPSGLAVDAAGDVYVANAGGGTVRKLAFSGTQVTTLALTDAAGTVSDLFIKPSGIAVAGTGTIYIADTGDHVIYKFPEGGSLDTLTVLAGLSGSAGYADTAGGAGALFNAPGGLALDSSQQNLYVADTGNHRIRKITLAGGTVSTVAADADCFNAPLAVAVDQNDNIYVADSGNDVVRIITPDGGISTLAGAVGEGGARDGAREAARFNQPSALVLDASGMLYVLDAASDTVRKLTIQNRNVETIAGHAGAGGSADGDGSAARFSKPAGIALTSAGGLVVADTGNHTLRLAQPPEGIVIHSHPQGVAAETGGSVQFSVAATGRPSLVYQWYYGALPITGATAGTYKISNVQKTDAGDYSVVVSNALDTAGVR
ncbi:MAG: immunoglobulin domain-containing protein, partial [Opitutaceae bacterium]|nr:immunoglobulin domain-containing protein [Opitutaceae bacterium]